MNDIIQYVLANFPNLFEVKHGDSIYFSKILQGFYNEPLRFFYQNLHVDIVPHDYNTSNCFIFRLILPNSSSSNYVPLKLRLADDIILPEKLCVLFYSYDIDIDARTDSNGNIVYIYDRQAIMRRYTIENIIDHE